MERSQMPASAKLIGLFLLAYIAYRAATRWALWRRQRAFQREKGTLPIPRYRTKDPIFGLDAALRNLRAAKEHRTLENARSRFTSMGRNTIMLVIRGRRYYGTTEPENLKTIQAVDFRKWGLPGHRKNAFDRLLGKGIFTADGIEWQHSRDMLRPNFVRSQVGDIDMFERHVAHLIAAIPRDGATVNLSDLFFRLTVDSATELLFGESTGSLTQGAEEGFAHAFTASQEHTLNGLRWGMLRGWIAPSTTFERDVAFVHSFVDYYVDRGLARRAALLAEKNNSPPSPASPSAPARYVFIDALVQQTPDRVRIRSELLNILLAGRDTTASLLTNVWWILSRRPDIWTRLQAEIAELRGAHPSFERLKELKFLRALLSESLRLYPVVPANSREALEDTTLPVGGGPDGRAPVFIPKGERVTWSIYSMHRRKDLFGADAEEFRPERWLDDPATGAKGLRPGWEYLPFNGGPRICLGQQYALTEASYTTARLCQAFAKIEARDDRPWTEHLTLTCVNLHGAKVGLTPRE